jgi:hypothetical protein
VKDGKKTEYKPAIDIVIAAYKMGGATEFEMEAYFETLTPDMMKSRLHGWQLWYVYAKEQGVTLELLRQHPNPAFILGGFVRFLAVSKIGDHKRREAMPAVQLIMEVVRPGFKIMESVYLKTIIQGYATGTVRQPRYKTIWNLGIMMDYIAKGPPSERLARRQLYGRAAFIFMTLGPLRPAAQIRLRPDQERREPDGSSIEVCGHSKTDKKRGVTWSVLRRVETVNLCPVHLYDLCKADARKRGCTTSIWCSEAGKPYTRSDVICKAGLELMTEGGIDTEKYKFYSARHAAIDAMFSRLGLDEKSVNAYTGHSHNSHTALNFYYHLNKAWVGQKLASLHGDGEKVQDEIQHEVIEDAALDAENEE